MLKTLTNQTALNSNVESTLSRTKLLTNWKNNEPNNIIPLQNLYENQIMRESRISFAQAETFLTIFLTFFWPTLNPQPSTLDPQPSTLNPLPSSLCPQPPTLNPQPSTHYPQPSTLNPLPSTLNPQPTTLKPTHYPQPSDTLALLPL